MSEHIFPDEQRAAQADKDDDSRRRWDEERRVSPPSDPVPPERPCLDDDATSAACRAAFALDWQDSLRRTGLGERAAAKVYEAGFDAGVQAEAAEARLRLRNL